MHEFGRGPTGFIGLTLERRMKAAEIDIAWKKFFHIRAPGLSLKCNRAWSPLHALPERYILLPCFGLKQLLFRRDLLLFPLLFHTYRDSRLQPQIFLTVAATFIGRMATLQIKHCFCLTLNCELTDDDMELQVECQAQKCLDLRGIFIPGIFRDEQLQDETGRVSPASERAVGHQRRLHHD